MATKGKGLAFQWIVAHVAYSEDDCLVWPFSRDPQGYGHLGLNGKLWKAYRLMCVLAHGEPPTNQHVASHTCGNGHTGCTNPRHLSWKTNSENQLERTAHGRRLPEHNRRKLTPQQKLAVQGLRGTMSIREIASQFGIKRGTVDYYHRKAREAAAGSD